jgi:hypothetical protein
MRSSHAWVWFLGIAAVACTPDWARPVKDAGAGADADETEGDGGTERDDAAERLFDADGSGGSGEAGAPEADTAPRDASTDAVAADDGGADGVCANGYVLQDGLCRDIDECFEGTHECHMTATCENTVGAYDCTCPLGYSGGTSAGFACAPRIVMGQDFGCALLSDGKVKCWGANDSGQLGDGTVLSRSTPTFVSGLDRVVAIAAHDSKSTCALRDDGSVVCWGDNGAGQLGDGTKTSRSTPTAAKSLSGVVAISVDLTQACAIVKDGGIQCWGDGWVVPNLLATPVIGLPAAGAIGLGCAVTTEGVVWRWGEVVNGGVPLEFSPVRNVLLVTGSVSVACALRRDGRVICWAQETANLVEQSFRDVVSLSSTFEFSYVVLRDGAVHMWRGLSADVPQYQYMTEPVDAVAVAGGGGGSSSACAVIREGTVRCWGINRSGNLGDGTITSTELTDGVYKVTTVTGLDLW